LYLGTTSSFYDLLSFCCCSWIKASESCCYIKVVDSNIAFCQSSDSRLLHVNSTYEFAFLIWCFTFFEFCCKLLVHLYASPIYTSWGVIGAAKMFCGLQVPFMSMDVFVLSENLYRWSTSICIKIVSGGRPEASKRNLNFQSATWHHLKHLQSKDILNCSCCHCCRWMEGTWVCCSSWLKNGLQRHKLSWRILLHWQLWKSCPHKMPWSLFGFLDKRILEDWGSLNILFKLFH